MLSPVAKSAKRRSIRACKRFEERPSTRPIRDKLCMLVVIGVLPLSACLCASCAGRRRQDHDQAGAPSRSSLEKSAAWRHVLATVHQHCATIVSPVSMKRVVRDNFPLAQAADAPQRTKSTCQAILFAAGRATVTRALGPNHDRLCRRITPAPFQTFRSSRNRLRGGARAACPVGILRVCSRPSPRLCPPRLSCGPIGCEAGQNATWFVCRLCLSATFPGQSRCPFGRKPCRGAPLV